MTSSYSLQSSSALEQAAKALVFVIEEQLFALPLRQVQEVVRAAWPMPVPRAPFGCLGALNVRGKPVPLVDLAVVLGFRKRSRPGELPARMLDCHVLLVRAEEKIFALLVDRVLDVGEDAGDLAPTEREQLKAWGRNEMMFTGLATVGSQKALMLSGAAILGAKRQRLLERAVAKWR